MTAVPAMPATTLLGVTSPLPAVGVAPGDAVPTSIPDSGSASPDFATLIGTLGDGGTALPDSMPAIDPRPDARPGDTGLLPAQAALPALGSGGGLLSSHRSTAAASDADGGSDAIAAVAPAGPRRAAEAQAGATAMQPQPIILPPPVFPDTSPMIDETLAPAMSALRTAQLAMPGFAPDAAPRAPTASSGDDASSDRRDSAPILGEADATPPTVSIPASPIPFSPAKTAPFAAAQVSQVDGARMPPSGRGPEPARIGKRDGDTPRPTGATGIASGHDMVDATNPGGRVAASSRDVQASTNAPIAGAQSQAVPATSSRAKIVGRDSQRPATIPDANAAGRASDARPAGRDRVERRTSHREDDRVMNDGASLGEAMPVPPAETHATDQRPTVSPATPIAQAVMASADRHLSVARAFAWIDGIARDIAMAAGTDGNARFTVSPANLGTVHVALSRDGDRADVAITAASADAAALLSRSTDRLVEDARAHGLEIRHATIETGAAKLHEHGARAAQPDQVTRQPEAPATTSLTDHGYGGGVGTGDMSGRRSHQPQADRRDPSPRAAPRSAPAVAATRDDGLYA